MSRYRNVCYLVCEADGYELPVGVFNRLVDAGKFLGITYEGIKTNVTKKRTTYYKGMRYRTYRIFLGEDK